MPHLKIGPSGAFPSLPILTKCLKFTIILALVSFVYQLGYTQEIGQPKIINYSYKDYEGRPNPNGIVEGQDG